ncbi:hypothetical protein, partial [Lactococcus petauri]|uniref:hypothetical protein n=1 Tax=Lactococcus petauri TaxID=1940789 RepID=UPI0021F0B64F
GLIGIDAVKKYLNSQLELAVDMTRNANTDVERKAAIRRCFGNNLNSLPKPNTSQPTMQETGCGTMARYVRITSNDFIQISQLVV